MEQYPLETLLRSFQLTLPQLNFLQDLMGRVDGSEVRLPSPREIDEMVHRFFVYRQGTIFVISEIGVLLMSLINTYKNAAA